MIITRKELLRRMEIVSDSRRRAIAEGNEAAVRLYDGMLAVQQENLAKLPPEAPSPNASPDNDSHWTDF